MPNISFVIHTYNMKHVGEGRDTKGRCQEGSLRLGACFSGLACFAIMLA